jgi:acetaldehyde dehydrogenase
MTRHKVAILGSGNIGTDLMLKLLERGGPLELAALVGIDPDSEGLALARARGVATTHEGLDGLLRDPASADLALVFDATSASAHRAHAPALAARDLPVVDLTPAALGPYVVPVANIAQHARARNVNMVTCGGQATIPIVWAAAQVAPVAYAEIVASIASRSAGPGTRANIDEFTQTTARGLEVVGGAARGKAIIILNPAEPPMIMRDTVYTLSETRDTQALDRAIDAVVAEVASYVPGYRMVQRPVHQPFWEQPLQIPGQPPLRGTLTSVFLEVEGAGHYLPRYAGNLDIMTSAALRMGELMVTRLDPRDAT